MTSFQYCSDLHLEFYTEDIPFNELINPKADNLILAGDIGYPSHKNYESFLQYCSNNFKHVILISGNHEYYGRIICETEGEIREIVKKFPNVTYLQNECLELPDNILVIGSTLWTNIPPHKKSDINRNINDYYKIYKKENQKITVEDTCEYHKESVRYITETISKNINKKIIVITHHLPSIKLISKKWLHYSNNSSFYTDLTSLISPPLVAWICGHTHHSTSTFIKDVFCSVNPKGYPREETGYSKDSVFTC